MKPDLPRTVGFWGASAVMVGIIIGSGIFRTPSSIAKELGDPWVILLMWLLGGVLSLFGALTYAELAVMYPQSGGVYVFLREGFGRCTSFVFGWTYLLITKPVAAAGIAIIFADQFNALPPVAGLIDAVNGSSLLHGANELLEKRPLGQHYRIVCDNRATTSLLLFVLTWVNVRGVRLSAGLAMVLTSFKTLALLVIVALALALMKGSSEHFAGAPAPVDPQTGLPRTVLAAIAPVMAAVLWTYDGWSDVGAIAGEVREPQRMLPRIYFTGTALITALYLAVNAVYIWMIPLPEMRGIDNIAPAVVERLLGVAGGVGGMIVAIVVLISTAGSTHGSILTGARISYAQARDGLLFAFLGRVHPRYQTPAASLWLQLALSITAVMFLRTFDRLAGSFVFTMWIFYGLAGAAIFVLRKRRPDADRPYKCWGYPAVPALFILSAAAMTGLSIYQSPSETLPWIGVLLAGVPVYYAWQRWVPSAPEPAE